MNVTRTPSRTIVDHEGYSYHFDAEGGPLVKVTNTLTRDCLNPTTHTQQLDPLVWDKIQQAAR